MRDELRKLPQAANEKKTTFLAVAAFFSAMTSPRRVILSALMALALLFVLSQKSSCNVEEETLNEVHEKFRPQFEEEKANTTIEKLKKVQHLALAKTQKTGSATLQNVIFRFGVNNDLVFALPEDEEGDLVFPVDRHINAESIRNGKWSELGDGPDIFALSSLWSREAVKAALPEDAVFITILRDPVAVFESMYIDFGLKRT